ncbi:unnamed protein product [Citrullus colocynthis]|uniref:Protein kinase domain-containing protein n=1 Tax=Citrullus colocynthis TaxID=252529 RepID=A0ABP0YV06_9ROSI
MQGHNMRFSFSIYVFRVHIVWMIHPTIATSHGLSFDCFRLKCRFSLIFLPTVQVDLPAWRYNLLHFGSFKRTVHLKNHEFHPQILNFELGQNCRRLVAVERLLDQKLNIIEVVMPCFCFSSKRNRDSSDAQTIAAVEEISNIPNVRLYSYEELRKATENFRSGNKLGQGGFGSVYKGRLGNGTLGAIKVLSMDSSQGMREFLAEINVISVINHDNLVKLHGCCVEGQHRILVYPYLENSSLDKMLFGG